jgi:1,4-alpha-glucan branching enzyme
MVMEPSALGSSDTLNAIVWGEYDRPFEVLGAHPIQFKPMVGVASAALAVRFTVWAPRALAVSVVGDFNQWVVGAHSMSKVGATGMWQTTVVGIGQGAAYQFAVTGQADGQTTLKADPYARAAQFRPAQASVVAAMPPFKALTSERAQANRLDAPISIYEVHAGSWRRHAAPVGSREEFFTWHELAQQLAPYVKSMGFTHLELLPITEHPFDGSWGYQTLGLYSPSSRFGDWAGLAHFVEACHALGLGVILDWVPAHFSIDSFGLARFDGSAQFEYADPREGFHRDWGTYIYDYSSAAVRNFLAGSALYWLERMGLDGLRVDAVASMLYRDYSRDSGQWVPNSSGGRENWEAVSLFRRINTLVSGACPGAMMIAEESTAFPKVTTAAKEGGLGFDFKWNMGWMHDTLSLMQASPEHRSGQYQQLVHTVSFAFSERFILPLSHDEVVHGKRSIFGRMPGKGDERFAQLRAYYGLMWGYPGKKLLFMGQEFAQITEWNHDQSLPWELAREPKHAGVQHWVTQLNQLYKTESALHEGDTKSEAFTWVVNDDAQQMVLAWVRSDLRGNAILVVTNLGARALQAYRMGLPNRVTQGGLPWRCVLSSDDPAFGGETPRQQQAVMPEAVPAQGRPLSIQLNLPAFSTQFFKVV